MITRKSSTLGIVIPPSCRSGSMKRSSLYRLMPPKTREVRAQPEFSLSVRTTFRIASMTSGEKCFATSASSKVSAHLVRMLYVRPRPVNTTLAFATFSPILLIELQAVFWFG